MTHAAMSGSFAITLPLTSKARGARLHGQRWMPANAPKAIILLAHGMFEHLGRYEHVAAHLTARGYAVYAIDHWGHGQSDGAPGSVPAFTVYADGMEGLLRHVEVEHPGTVWAG
jgi:alpha-beta hydrolase superfamily lysophospholipase